MAIVFLVGLVGAIQAPGQPALDAHKSALAVNIQKNKKENDARNKALVEKAKAQNTEKG